MPSVGWTSPFGEVGNERSIAHWNSSLPEHPLRRPCKTRLVTAMWALRRRLFQLCLGREASGAPGRDASDQLLQPTCCHEYPPDLQLPGSRLSPRRPPQPSLPPCPRVSTDTATRLSTTMPDSRYRHLRPWVSSTLDGVPPAAAAFPASGYPPGLPKSRQLASTLSAENEPGTATTDALGRHLGFA
jgi:hypothetical protein